VPLIVLCLGALALRLLFLDHESLWFDELVTVERAGHARFAEMISVGVATDVHPPGYFALIWCVQHAGRAAWLLRLPSLIAGVAAVPLAFDVGRRLCGNREAWLAALAAAFLPRALMSSVEARPYALLLCLSLASALLALRFALPCAVRRGRGPGGLIQGRGGWRLIAGWSVVTVALGAVHYFGVLVALAQLGAAWWVSRRRVIVVPATALVAACVAWMPVMATQLARGHDFWIPQPSASDAMRVVVFAFGDPLLAGAAVGLIGLHFARGAASRKDVFLAALVAVPFAAVYLFSSLCFPLLVDRYFIGFVPALWLLAARALCALPRRAFVAAPLAVLLAVSLLRAWREPRSEQYRELVAALLADGRSAPLVSAGGDRGFDYYLAPAHSADLDETLTAAPPRLWLLEAHCRLRADERAHLDADFVASARIGRFAADATLYERRTAARLSP
jgi:uncharacterized membrane protein